MNTDRRATTRRATDDLAERVTSLEQNVVNIRVLLGTNIELTRMVADETKQLRELWTEARAAFHLFNRLISSIRWCARFVLLPVGLVLVALYAWRHGGKLPTWFTELWGLVWD